MTTTTTTATIKGILIDPAAQSIRAVDAPADFELMKAELLQCELAQPVDLGEGVTAWVDEEGLLGNWDAIGFSEFAGMTHPLAGRVLLVGTTPDGDMADLPEDIDVELVRCMTSFVDPKAVRIPGPTFTTMNGDGTTTVKTIGPKYLTYDNH